MNNNLNFQTLNGHRRLLIHHDHQMEIHTNSTKYINKIQKCHNFPPARSITYLNVKFIPIRNFRNIHWVGMSLISDFVALLQIVLCGWEIFGSDRSPRRGNLVCACVRYFSQLRFKDSKSIFEGVLQRRAERKQELSQKVKRESSEESSEESKYK